MTLELDAVSVSFQDGGEGVHPLRNVSLRVEPGELIVVSGPSGTGKSTLLAVSGLLLAPSGGEVRINGTATSQLRGAGRSRFRREHVAFVFQSANLMPSLTAVEQLQLVLSIRRARPADAADRARRLLDEVGLGHRIGHRPHELSGGERQRVGVARALIAEPRVLLVDEPTAGLDATRSREIAELLIRETHARQTCTVVATHDIERFARARRIERLLDGRLEPIAAPSPT